MKRVLFIVPHRLGRSPGQRFRFEQYLDVLEEEGIDYTISHIITASDDKVFYGKGNYLGKAWVLIKSIFKRLRDVFRANKYDVVFIYREAIMLGTTVFERWLCRRAKKSILDFDDSIWLMDISEGNAKLAFLKKPEKTNDIIPLVDQVVVGNRYLAEHARQFNDNVKVIPTTIDMNYHQRSQVDKSGTGICIGWTGSSTTVKHFRSKETVFERLKEELGEKIYFKLIANSDYKNEKLSLKTTQWSVEREVKELCEIDIGIMPLPDDQWSKGKCGFKGLQYMSLGIPTIMSPVGVNSEIIEHGVNGYLADTDEDWYNYLKKLIESDELRKRLGKAGAQTIHERYSKSSQREEFLSLFK